MTEQGLNITVIEEIKQLAETGEWEQIRTLLEQVHPADIAELLDELDSETAVILFGLLPTETASEVLDETVGRLRGELVESVDDERLADLLDELPMDDAAEFLEDLPEEVSNKLLSLMEPEEAEDVRELLAYEEGTAGRLMNRDVVALRRQWTVDETLTYLRSLEDAETLAYLYVVDRDDKLIGVVALRNLVLAQPNQTIEEIMSREVVSVPVTADQEELAEMVAKYDYFAIPVVDEKERLVGVVTVDDVLDIFEEEVTEDIQRLGGSEPLEQPYFAVSAIQIFQKRIGWLLLLFVASTLSGEVIRMFQHELDVVVALGFFITLITGTGGNAGSQTVATIIRAITLDEVRISNMWHAWRREVSVGFMLGFVMGVVGIARALLWHTGFGVAMVVALTLPIVVIWSTTVATIIPILADRFNIDPTVISGPMIATIVDASGLLIYFSLAKAILGI
ncbi:MAG: magnesium transporter [Candidatus Promineifilaceae bacterium]